MKYRGFEKGVNRQKIPFTNVGGIFLLVPLGVEINPGSTGGRKNTLV